MITRGVFRRQLNRLVYVRTLHQSGLVGKAQVFAMPAMSPTMEKGGVVEWKFKVGEPFSAGDVLLEVETDKAQIDVEAQDDGKLAKILVNDGAKDINVGEPIAYLAEPEDDLATLELPQSENKQSTKAPEPKVEKDVKASAQKGQGSEPKAQKQTQVSSSSGSKDVSGVMVKADPAQTLLPSVQLLLHANNISNEDALNNIQASGPNGRILKGDVLSYLGKVSQEAIAKLTKYIQKGEVLDLSNIELKKPEPASKAPESVVKKEPVIFTEQLHLKVEPNVTFEQFSRSLKSYIDEARIISHGEPVSNVQSDYYDALFEELITPEPRKPRFSVSYDIIPLNARSLNAKQQDDIFDLLAGTKNTPASTESGNLQSNEVLVNLSVQVSDKFSDAKLKAERFVDYVKDLEIPSEL